MPAGTPPPITIEPGERVAEYAAAEAIRSYASHVLGIAVKVKTASGRTGTITLPGEVQRSVDAAVTLAGTTYSGILTDGLASVSLGDGKITITMDVVTAHIRDNRIGFCCIHIDLESITHLRRLMELNLGDEEQMNRELSALIFDICQAPSNER